MHGCCWAAFFHLFYLPSNGQCTHHIETSQLICSANELTGFYRIGSLVVKGLRIAECHIVYVPYTQFLIFYTKNDHLIDHLDIFEMEYFVSFLLLKTFNAKVSERIPCFTSLLKSLFLFIFHNCLVFIVMSFGFVNGYYSIWNKIFKNGPRSYLLSFFTACLPQILLVLFLNILFHLCHGSPFS